ncbi:MAG: phosphatase PAP2 family protein [Magnetococcales bacterium]|nr:phosphatase PAP2 family protein [Magnetococcales bacterium]
MGRSFGWTLALLALVLLVAETTTLDLRVQDFFYTFEVGRWWIDKEAYWPRVIFYTGAKWAVVLVAIGILVALLWSRKSPSLIPCRRPLMVLLLSLILVPGTISSLKNVTNVHCPWSLTRYGGTLPFVPVLDTQPADFPAVRPGKCYPAGHPSGGFAFMALFFLFSTRRRQWLGLGFGISLGWIMGIYQMMKGAHFLSHVLVSMLLSWLIIQGVAWGVERKFISNHESDPRKEGNSPCSIV